jgi:D-threo-aldose 1-dehydrogenase
MKIPSVIFGTSTLGNLYEALPFEVKLSIVRECIKHAPDGIAMFDTAGKYGAGLALEVLGQCLEQLQVPSNKVIINNKLGWYRVPLTTPQPTFEGDVWKDLKYDAIQRISYDGIIACYEQGNNLLGKYQTQMVSVHDPDEYLAAAINEADSVKRYNDILEAYKALQVLKQAGKISSIGIGAKNWRTIQRIAKDVTLDWVMIANSLSVKTHEQSLLEFINVLHEQGVTIINSAVFNGGFLVGKDYYNYKLVDSNTDEGRALLHWRTQFFTLCKQFNILPAEACFSFGFNIPGVHSVAVSTSHPDVVQHNIALASKQVPAAFWKAMQAQGLLEPHYHIYE